MSSNSDLMLDVSQAAELKLAFRRNGWNNAEIKTLSEGDILADVLRVLKGKAEIKTIEHLIDCNADPFVPDGWSVEEHKKHGLLKFNPEKISLYLSKKQKGEGMSGHALRKELADKLAMNANVLDYLLAHPKLIPEDWKGKYVCFWDTIYHNSEDKLCFRYLRWLNLRWSWNGFLLSFDFGPGEPAALLN